MWPLVTYSNYFEIVTITFLVSSTRLIRGNFVFNTILLQDVNKNFEFEKGSRDHNKKVKK